MGVRIVAGCARNLELAAPPGTAVRPTAIRARKALFDSLGALTGLAVVDLFAGSDYKNNREYCKYCNSISRYFRTSLSHVFI